ncbi:TPA: hypothetical protein IUD88_001219 [Enterococcus faecalis]|nr:hypothetical protein [Enterococcus faecalis]HBI2045503.1 hypothetical protein [Enterococcus faecalis]
MGILYIAFLFMFLGILFLLPVTKDSETRRTGWGIFLLGIGCLFEFLYLYVLSSSLL